MKALTKTTSLFLLLALALLALGAGCARYELPSFASLAPIEAGVDVLPYRIAGYGTNADGTNYVKVVVKDRYMGDERLLRLAADITRGEVYYGYVEFYCEADCLLDDASVAVIGARGEAFEVLRRISSWRGAPSETQFARYAAFRKLYHQNPLMAGDELIAQMANIYGLTFDEALELVDLVLPFTKPGAVGAPAAADQNQRPRGT